MELIHDRYGPDPGPEQRPLIILHGLFGSARNWQALAKRLGQTRPVIVPDLRNHGRSPHAATMTYDALATDVAQLMDAIGTETADIVGHSMGGKVAARLALTDPGRVNRLVVVDIAPVSYPERGFGHYIQAMRDVPLTAVFKRRDADDALAQAIPDRAIRGFLLQNLAVSPEGAAWRPNLDAIETALPQLYAFPDSDHLTPFAGPTLFLAGDRSDYITPAMRDTIRALFPHARVAAIKGAGHWVHADQPEAFLTAVEQALTVAA